MTKEERAKLALEKRQKEVEEQRKRQEEERKARENFDMAAEDEYRRVTKPDRYSSSHSSSRYDRRDYNSSKRDRNRREVEETAEDEDALLTEKEKQAVRVRILKQGEFISMEINYYE